MHRLTFQRKMVHFRIKDEIRNWISRAEEDRAVVYGVLASCYQLGSAPITMILIVHYLDPEVQGFYYTFMSLVALQSIFELGLYVVVLNVASHQWAHLALDGRKTILGDVNALSRPVSLGRFVFKWYAVASLLFGVGVGIGGYIFLSSKNHQEIAWVSPPS